MESLKDIIIYSTNKINNLCTSLYTLVIGFRSPYVVNLAATNVDISTINILNDTIILQGTLTANVIVIVSNTIRTYKIVNLCTGAYYVTIKTSEGTGYNSYGNDRLTLVCDGTKLVLTDWNENLIAGVERLTPKYAKGNPLYVKVIQYSGLPAGVTDIPHGITGTFTVIGITGSLAMGTLLSIVPISFTDYTGLGSSVGVVSNGTLYIRTVIGSNWGAGHNLYAIVWYIKV